MIVLKIFRLNRQIVLQLVGYRLVEDACQNFTEQSRDHEHQYDNKDRGCYEDKKPACSDDCNEKAVDAHFLQAFDIFSDKAVVVNDSPEHPAQLLYDQKGEDTGQKQDDTERVIILCKIDAVSAVESNGQRQRYDDDDSGIEHEVQQIFCKQG